MNVAQGADGGTNWFDSDGQDYARFRPDYPPALADHLAGLCERRQLAVDVGCGTGQLSTLIAGHFDEVVGLDPSADQIANASAHDRVRYSVALAERLPLADASVDLITAAQAAHWFDLPAFHAEARRIAANGAILALISYGVLRLDPELDACFQHFYHRDIGPFWPPERGLVDSGYATLDFPFEELAPPALEIPKQWSLQQFLGYIATWSAVRRARAEGQEARLHDFARTLAGLWRNPAERRKVAWPINMRLGRLAAR